MSVQDNYLSSNQCLFLNEQQKKVIFNYQQNHPVLYILRYIVLRPWATGSAHGSDTARAHL